MRAGKVHGERAVYFEAGEEGGKVTVEPSPTTAARLSKETKVVAGPGAGESDRSHSQSRSSSSEKVKHRAGQGAGAGSGASGHFRRIGVVSLPPQQAEIQETESEASSQNFVKAEVARRISLDDLSAAFQGKH